MPEKQKDDSSLRNTRGFINHIFFMLNGLSADLRTRRDDLQV
jgi:hypothetical protein